MIYRYYCGAGGKLYRRLYSLIISELSFSISRFNPYFLLFFYYF
nr:MAG TPA: CSTF-50, ISOFORM B-BINDING PROTEIN, 3' END MRNA.4A [Caudoviricetes sp.]